MPILKPLPQYPSALTRLIFLIIGILGLILVSYLITGSIFPPDNEQANIFQSGLLLVILGSLFLEDKFTKPVDAVVNSLTGIISLVTVYSTQAGASWYLIFSFCTLVLLIGIACIAVGIPGEVSGPKVRVSNTLYTASIVLGRANLLFSIVFIYAVLACYPLNSKETYILALFWGFYLILKPLKIPQIFQAIFSNTKQSLDCQGIIIRLDHPNLVRVQLAKDSHWGTGPFISCLGDGTQWLTLPLYQQVQNEQVIGTGLLLQALKEPLTSALRGSVYRTTGALPPLEEPFAAYTSEELYRPLGLLCEGSTIAKLKFETWRSGDCREGLLVYCYVSDQRIYYQITDAATREEEFQQHRHGFQVVEAMQLGTLDPEYGFRKFNWLPEMNTPIFKVECTLEGELKLAPNEFIIGHVPGSKVGVICDIDKLISHHTAILGVTGTGKTELAYDVIQKAISSGIKVFCVDITGDYLDRLKVLNPKLLSISDQLAAGLGEKLFEVEAGEFGAGKEKKVLKSMADELREDIDHTVTGFLNGSRNLGIFTLPSISNTKATVYITEIYLSSIFNYARDPKNRNQQRILVVLEEAHTVIPEAKTMGVADYDSQGMVARIAQIALQGRKYDVGLLVIAQRTANVSKTVLTQCNTTIAFTSFDQTGIEFMANIFGGDYAGRLSNLKFLQAIVFGKGVKSERPVIVEIPRKEQELPN
ncbi:MAG TPA: DUF87 domain-containing protein [Bacillota bacterium]|nr:DUF87 domain-containing protein [Bacillota bacterium]